MRAEVVLLAGRVVDEGRVELVEEGRCVEATGRLAVVGRLDVVVVGRTLLLLLGLTLLLLLLGLTLLPAVLAFLVVLGLGVRELIEPAVLLRRTLAT